MTILPYTRAASLAALFASAGLSAGRPFEFAREIGSVFTRNGCNDSHCHGGVKGRGGLRLSPEASDPHEDYKSILVGGEYQVLTDQPKEPSPRVNLPEPEKSLLLSKATMAVAHGGGKRFAVDSRDYRTLLDWVRSGAPYGSEPVARIERLEVLPSQMFLEKQERRELKAIAHFSDGRQEDVTSEVRFESNDSSIVKISGTARAEAVAAGETALLARGLGRVGYAITAVIREPLPDYPAVSGNNFIDDFIFAKLRKLRIAPSELSSDEEFLRRVCLDLVGMLPPPERTREFFASRDPRKRERLIALLLDSPQFADLWTFRFADLFRVGASSRDSEYWDWLYRRIAKNTPYDQIARERIAAAGYAAQGIHFGPAKPTPIERVVAEETRVFLGRRMDCAQCHNHPYDIWTQDQFWGLASFFSQMTWTNWASVQTLYDDPEGSEADRDTSNKGTLVFLKAVHPRSKKVATPRFLDGSPLPDGEKDPRLALAKWMTASPYFAETAANRIWSYFFGRGIVNPPDDFRAANPPTHPDLLARLAEDFRSHGHDLKRLMRLIVESRAYQLAGAPNATNRHDELNYSWSRPRALEAEIKLDAVSSATGAPEIFSTAEGSGKAPPGARAVQLTYPAGWTNRFLEVNGCPLRDSLPERSPGPSVTQAMHMLAGSTFTAKIAAPGGRLDKLLSRSASDREIIEELYLASLVRLPAEAERQGIQQRIEGRQNRREAFEDLLWSLISSREFSYNH